MNSSGQTINREFHGTQFDKGLTMTWVPLLRRSVKEMLGTEGRVETTSINIPLGGDLLLEMVGSCCGVKGKPSQ